MAKMSFAVLAAVPLLLIFIYPGTNPGYGTPQAKAEISLPAMAIAIAITFCASHLTSLSLVDFPIALFAGHDLLDLTCVRLC